MALHFCVLGSGSAGNASFLQLDGFGALIDIGLGPRQISHRLASAGANWTHVKAVLLTHTHTDHWNVRTLSHLKRQRIPIYCHAVHEQWLASGASFDALQKQGLVRRYEARTEITLAPGLRCRPVPLRHDSGPTFGFRFESAPDLFGQSATLGYAADLGCWDEELVEQLADVEALALEFNHDVGMQHASGRHPDLIERVLGDEGHLSNAQAAELLRAILSRSSASRLRHVVQLHLSRECNTPALARACARAVLAAEIEIHTARQDQPGPWLNIGRLPEASMGRPGGAGISRLSLG
jgi:phosphoribosyl 1,2-cyclic phosphodiesterase